MDIKQLQEIFTFHPIKEGQAEKYQQLRLTALNFSILINDLCPDSREKSLAITKLQETLMMANAAIAIHE